VKSGPGPARMDTMDPLREWHDYVDRLSRPARRLAGEDPQSSRWRPWMDTQAPEPQDEEVIRPGSLPDLAPALGIPGLSRDRFQLSHAYEDPTVHDTLKPIPAYDVPQLSAPGFEITAPTLGPASAPAPEAEAVASPEPEAAPKEEEAAAPVTPAKRAELLAQIRAQSGPQAANPKSRESLAERLLDPTLTLEETALFLGVCSTTVRRYTNRGLLKHFRTQGNQRRFRLSDVVEFLDSRSTEIEADARAEREGKGKK
jgi:excisionase family DNA binding protein